MHVGKANDDGEFGLSILVGNGSRHQSFSPYQPMSMSTVCPRNEDPEQVGAYDERQSKNESHGRFPSP